MTNQSVTKISNFPATKACKTEDGITIHGIGETLHKSYAWDAKMDKVVELPAGTIIQLGGSVGAQRIAGTQTTVKRVNVHPYGPEVCFLTTQQKEAVAKAYGHSVLTKTPQLIENWYANLDDDLQETATKAA